MDGGTLHRLRWRRRGAWMWPAFTALTILDAVIVHALPVRGDRQSLAGGAITALALNLVGVVLLTLPVSATLRRVRPDLPKLIARDHAGTGIVIAVAAGLLTAGLVHRPTIVADRSALREAVVRAQAWIGDRAPAEFRRDVAHVDTYTIEPRRIYRACVWSSDRPRTYCVVVKPHSITFAGYEPNLTFAAGTG
jgi:hypothetical protein